MIDIATKAMASLPEVEAEMHHLLGRGPVADAARYHLAAGGGRVRAGIALTASAALDIDPEGSIACAATAELLHNASLVHDDLQDGDRTRRGQPAVWVRYDKATAISAGDLLISAAYAALTHHPQPAAAISITHEAVAATTHGQALDLAAGSASFDEYVQVATAKSGPLLALPMRLVLLAGGISGDALATRAGHSLALAYQIIDDLGDRARDREQGAMNACHILEAEGRSSHQAAALAISRARHALDLTRTEARRLPAGAGAVYLDLADRLVRQLPDSAPEFASEFAYAS